MTDLRTNQLKQLNYLDKAINYLDKALTVGDNQEELGYNNGKIATKMLELLEIYDQQFSAQNIIDNDDTLIGEDYNELVKNTLHKGVF